MDCMRTPLLTSLILLASATTAFAQANPPPGAAPVPPAAPGAPATATPTEAPVEAPLPPAPPPPPPTPVGKMPPPLQPANAPATVPEVAEPVTKIGVVRLPASAYPAFQIRGLTHGSLWLTFHGMQWPYLPNLAAGERFVIGMSGWGWVDTSYQKFGPSSTDTSFTTNNIKYWKGQAYSAYSLAAGEQVKAMSDAALGMERAADMTNKGAAKILQLWVDLNDKLIGGIVDVAKLLSDATTVDKILSFEVDQFDYENHRGWSVVARGRAHRT